MAYAENNPSMGKVSGKLGNTVVIKQYNGKTVYCKVPTPSGNESPAQKQNRDQFREASAWSKQVLLDPVHKEYFLQEARRLKLKDAYTAAMGFKLREIKALCSEGEWIPMLTLKEATAAATRRSKRQSDQNAASHTQPSATTNSNEITDLRKSVEQSNRILLESLAAMQKSIQESLSEMNKAMQAITELVKSSNEVQKPAPQREQIKHAIQTNLRPAIASMVAMKRSSENVPAEILNLIPLPDTSLFTDASESNLSSKSLRSG
ncbi:MAG: hypothetical protein QM762_09165 [Chryseolinea sp.]